MSSKPTSVRVNPEIHKQLQKEGYTLNDAITEGARHLLMTPEEKRLEELREEASFPKHLLQTLRHIQQEHKATLENKEYLEALLKHKADTLRVPYKSLYFYFKEYYDGDAVDEDILTTTRAYLVDIEDKVKL